MALQARSHTVALIQFNLLVVVMAILLLFDLFAVELFYILTFLGLLVITHVFAPVDKEPQWYFLTKWLSRLGFIGLGYILLQRVVMILGT